MLKELFDQQKKYLNSFFEKLDLTEAEKFLELLASSAGIPIFCGVGKSALVAEKIAMTMTSTGSKALFLSPTNALHGDIGIVTEGDLLVLLSKSGETDELLQIIPYARNRKAKVVAIVCNPESRLAKAADVAIHLPLERELCPFDLAPTTSAALQMVFGDVIAVALMQKKSFSLDDYALNHPAGRIGRRISMRVRDLMIGGEGIPLCSPNDKLADTLIELSDKQCGCVLISGPEKNLLGIFTDGDLRRSLQEKGAAVFSATMEELMIKNPRAIESNELVTAAMEKMESNQKQPITVLPALEKGKIVGIIKMHDIVQSGI